MGILKKRFIFIAVILLLALLFVPIPTGVAKDGGSKMFTALTYKMVKWNRIISDGPAYKCTRVYWGTDARKGLDELWKNEEPLTSHYMNVKVIEITGKTILAEPLGEDPAGKSCDRISFSAERLKRIEVGVGDYVKVTYIGGMKENNPAQIDVTDWMIAKELRSMEYNEEWLNKDSAEKWEDGSRDVVITEIYSNCFFATSVVPFPYIIKFNGILPKEWCVGDQISVTYNNTYYDTEQERVESDFTSVEESTFELDPNASYKPVIYLYPETEKKVSVKLSLDGEFLCAYPSYGNGWEVTAFPDGTLKDSKGQVYNYLYWEGTNHARWDMSRGACVKGKDTAAFLEKTLEKMGLTRREANEFIVFWLPLMQNNPYNVISFQTDVYTDSAKLDISPKPDTLIRVFMVWAPAKEKVKLRPQTFESPQREGFTVVEWGGSKQTSIIQK